MRTSREIRLVRWPRGLPKISDFEIVESQPQPAEENQVVVRNLFMSVDPYMRGRLRPGPSYTSSFQIGKALSGGAVGIVEESRSVGLEPGDYVVNGMGFHETFVANAAEVRKIHPESIPPSAFLGVMGMPGMTAYVGLLNIGQARKGELMSTSTMLVATISRQRLRA
jgi:NADPH-dependent curcumin reductase CurA